MPIAWPPATTSSARWGARPRVALRRRCRRDQSYFLFSTTPEQLDFLRFPLGHLPSKDATRELAARYGLRVADKPDSQDICFVPNGNYASVIEKLRPGAAEPGEIVHADGRVLGSTRASSTTRSASAAALASAGSMSRFTWSSSMSTQSASSWPQGHALDPHRDPGARNQLAG
jgi:tRNA U34 2-thiouridine synthase MnmA/TrmU